MDITPFVPGGRQIVNGYGDGGFTIAGVRHEGAVLVLPEITRAWDVAAWSVEALPGLLAALDGSALELLLIGCGRSGAILSAAVRQPFRERGIGLDAMDTGAACRTYNVLLAEGRQVGAALVAI